MSHQSTRFLSSALLSSLVAIGGVSAHADGTGSGRTVLSAVPYQESLPSYLPMPSGERSSTLQFAYDDGSINVAYGVFRIPNNDRNLAGVYLNRFPVGHPLKVDSISIFWPPQAANVASGLPLMLVAYYDADTDGNPANAVRLGGNVEVEVGTAGTWSTYPVEFQLPAAGDLYVGFVSLWARVPDGIPVPRQFPGSADSDNSHCQSYMVYPNNPQVLVNYDNIGANAVIEIVHSRVTLEVDDLMIRATGQTLPGDDLFANGFDNLILCTQ